MTKLRHYRCPECDFRAAARGGMTGTQCRADLCCAELRPADSARVEEQIPQPKFQTDPFFFQ